MSASTVSITANTAARRRPVVDKKSSGIELLPNEAQVNGAASGDNNASKDLSHHSIRGEAVLERTTAKDLVQLKRAGLGNSTVSPRRSRKAAVTKPEKSRWVMLASVFTKNFVLLLVLIGLVQMVRRLALKSVDYPSTAHSGLTEFEGRIAELGSSVKTTANMIQFQVEVLNKKIEKEVGGLRTEMSKRIDEKGVFLENELKNLGARTDDLKKSVEELKAVDWLSKENFEKFYEELKKARGSSLDANEVGLDDIRAYAKEIVHKEIEKHAADGLGRVDYALASGGGMVLKHSEPLPGRKVHNWFFTPSPSVVSGIHQEAAKMLRPSFGEPGECFPLKGSSGYVEIRLRTAIIPEAITLEHVAKSVAYDRSTAPKDCRVSGWLQGKDFNVAVEPEKMFLLTEFAYDLEKSSAQTFNVLESAASYLVDTVRLDIASNHGSPLLTCIYRLRVHGSEPDSVSMMARQA